MEKWNNKVRRLRDKDKKLLNTIGQIYKRKLRSDVDTNICAEISKRVSDTVARDEKKEKLKKGRNGQF